MDERIKLSYFYGKEAEQFSFYKIPKLLFTDEYFKRLSVEAKVLYGLMLDWYEKDEEELRKKTNDRSKAPTIEEYMIGDHL